MQEKYRIGWILMYCIDPLGCIQLYLEYRDLWGKTPHRILIGNASFTILFFWKAQERCDSLIMREKRPPNNLSLPYGSQVWETGNTPQRLTYRYKNHMTWPQPKELDSSTYAQALKPFCTRQAPKAVLIHYGVHDRVNRRRDSVKDTRVPMLPDTPNS